MGLSQAVAPFSRSFSGTAAVEFALILPIFLLFLFGTIQFGVVIYVQNEMVNAAREGARRLAVDDTTTEVQAEAIVQTYLGHWPFNFNIQAEDTTTTGSDFTRVTVTVPMSEAGVVVDIMGFFTNRTLTAQAMMRGEG